MVNLVAFHAEFPDKPQLVPPHPKHKLERVVPDHGQMLDLLGRSALLTQPGCHLTLLANPCFKPRPDSLFAIQRVSASSASVMLDRTRVQKAYVDAHDFATPIVFLDTDVLLNGELKGLFAGDFDIGLTWRPLAEAPVNGGLILVNNQNPDAVRQFFSQFLDTYETRFARQAAWFGDQAALCKMLGLKPNGELLPPPQSLGDVRVAFFPCETYNFTPVNQPAALARPLDDKAVLHFKGPRKWMMRLYWEAYLAGREGGVGAESIEQSARAAIDAMIAADVAAATALGG